MKPEPAEPAPAEEATALLERVATALENAIKMIESVGEKKQCSCGRTIYIVITHRNTRIPYTDEFINHFADCPNRDQYRRRK